MACYRAPPLEVQADCVHWAGLGSQAANYRAILCDLWGVVHNGVRRYDAAIEALVKFRENHGQVVLISNAPRPSRIVSRQLEALGVASNAYDAILTSGDLTQSILCEGIYGDACYHIGPERDLGLFDGASVARVGHEGADFILCTGFEDDETDTPETYRMILEACRARDLPFICANPDKLVERDGRLIACAGQIADFYQEIGGQVIHCGKPHDPIYVKARALIGAEKMRPEQILAIGDGLATDIAGAVQQKFHALFITSGIARSVDRDKVSETCRQAGFMPQGWMSDLVW